MTEEPRGTELVRNAQAFDRWASNFAGVYDFFIELMWGRRLRKAIAHIKGPRVLEVSFGTGYLLTKYANNYETTGLDYNPNMIEAATQRLAKHNVKAHLIEGDAHAMPFEDGSFDTLINSDAFTLYSDSKKAMSEFHRVLAADGRLILLEYNYPSNRNWMGMLWMRVPKMLSMPYVDFNTVLTEGGFEFDDYPVGLWGTLHMYVCKKK